jgi:hypothetical protein
VTRLKGDHKGRPYGRIIRENPPNPRHSRSIRKDRGQGKPCPYAVYQGIADRRFALSAMTGVLPFAFHLLPFTFRPLPFTSTQNHSKLGNIQAFE